MLVKGTTNGTITDLDGKFTLDAPDNGTLVVSYIGFTTQEVLINGKTTFQIKLGEDSKALEEVVVIGYGTRSKRDVTTAISMLTRNNWKNNYNECRICHAGNNERCTSIR